MFFQTQSKHVSQRHHFATSPKWLSTFKMLLISWDQAKVPSLIFKLYNAGAEFEVVQLELEEPLKSQYGAAAKMWSQLRREFLYALEQVAEGQEEGTNKKGGNMLWRFFWASHQRFFRHMCMAAKVCQIATINSDYLLQLGRIQKGCVQDNFHVIDVEKCCPICDDSMSTMRKLSFDIVL